MRIGTLRLTFGIVAGRMTGASIDAGPSPTTAATPDGSMAMCSGVIEKRLATPTGRSDCGDLKPTRTGTDQTSLRRTAGSSGWVQEASSEAAPRLTVVTCFPNLAVSMFVLAVSDGHIARVAGDRAAHCSPYAPAPNWLANDCANAITAGGGVTGVGVGPAVDVALDVGDCVDCAAVAHPERIRTSASATATVRGRLRALVLKLTGYRIAITARARVAPPPL
jgi:hypothetical protein